MSPRTSYFFLRRRTHKIPTDPYHSYCSSDADSDVLADYVLALIRSDAPDDEIRKVSVENLEDFLRERASCPSLYSPVT